MNYNIYNFFNWRKIALQGCVGFCHAAMQISDNYTYHLLESTPLGHHRAPS